MASSPLACNVSWTNVSDPALLSLHVHLFFARGGLESEGRVLTKFGTELERGSNVWWIGGVFFVLSFLLSMRMERVCGCSCSTSPSPPPPPPPSPSRIMHHHRASSSCIIIVSPSSSTSKAITSRNQILNILNPPLHAFSNTNTQLSLAHDL